MLRHIAWFNEAPVEPDPKGGLTSPDPQATRRCLAPARALEEMGVECSVFGNLHDADPLHVGKHLQKLQTDIVVIGHITGPALLRLARAAKHLGCYVVADFGAQDEISPDLEKLLPLADQLVVASPEIADRLKHRGLSTLIIPDCDGEDGHAPDTVAGLWIDCFRKMKAKPPVCANTNEPLASNG